MECPGEGYDEICWGHYFSTPPPGQGEFVVQPNTLYRDWVLATLAGGIPRTGVEIVPHPDGMEGPESRLPLNAWLGRRVC